MKKLILAMLVAFGGLTVIASANGGDVEFCALHPDSPICGYNSEPIKGDDGADGYTPIKGVDYFDGDKGDKGDTGLVGKDGADGQDFNSKAYEEAYYTFLEYGKKATEYYEDLAAGSAAMAAIDFGTTCKGVTEGGIGIGYSSSFDGHSTVGAIGIKHGITDNDALIIKTWVAESDAYAIGGAITHKF